MTSQDEEIRESHELSEEADSFADLSSRIQQAAARGFGPPTQLLVAGLLALLVSCRQ